MFFSIEEKFTYFYSLICGLRPEDLSLSIKVLFLLFILCINLLYNFSILYMILIKTQAIVSFQNETKKQLQLQRIN